MLLNKKNLKKIINQYLNEGMLDNIRYPCNVDFLQKSRDLIYNLRFKSEKYILENSKVYYEFFKTIYPSTKISFEDFFVVFVDHYLNYQDEKDQLGDSTGPMQIKPQGVLDALRTQGARYYDASKHQETSKNIRNTAENIFKSNSYALNIIKKTGLFIDGIPDSETGEKIKPPEIISIIEDNLEKASHGDYGILFNIFIGMGLLMSPGVNSIKRYIAGKSDLSEIRKDRHDIIRVLYRTSQDTLFQITDYIKNDKFGYRQESISYENFLEKFMKFEIEIQGKTTY